MRLDINGDDTSDPHWVVSHGKLDEGAEKMVTGLTQAFNDGLTLHLAVMAVAETSRGRDEMDVIEALLLTATAFVQSDRIKQ